MIRQVCDTSSGLLIQQLTTPDGRGLKKESPVERVGGNRWSPGGRTLFTTSAVSKRGLVGFVRPRRNLVSGPWRDVSSCREVDVFGRSGYHVWIILISSFVPEEWLLVSLYPRDPGRWKNFHVVTLGRIGRPTNNYDSRPHPPESGERDPASLLRSYFVCTVTDL